MNELMATAAFMIPVGYLVNHFSEKLRFVKSETLLDEINHDAINCFLNVIIGFLFFINTPIYSNFMFLVYGSMLSILVKIEKLKKEFVK